MQAELQALRHNYRELVLAGGANGESLDRPKTAAEIIASCEENYDVELAELFRRNERGLREIREGLDAAKLELSDPNPTPSSS